VADEHDITSEPPDSIGRALMIFALLLLIAVVGVGAGMVLYLRDGFELPRSASERDIASYTVAVRENPDDQANHIKLAYAYAQGGRTDLAMESIALARQIEDNAAVDVAEGDALRMNGDYGEALAAYRIAETRAEETYAEAVTDMEKRGVAFPIDKTVLVRATHGQALVLWEIDRPEDALAAIGKALDNAPDDASLYVLLGKYSFESGDVVGAEEAYLAALRFVPDYPAAIEGLRELEGAADE